MAGDLPINREQALADALEQMEAAIELLDLAEAPAQIGAHLDLAICQLRDVIGLSSEVPEATRLNNPQPD